MSNARVTKIGDARRAKTKPPKNYACSECGEQWFMAKITLARTADGSPGDAVGWAVPLRCVNCGTAAGG